MQIITAIEARALSTHAQSWIDANMLWFMNRVMDTIAHEVAAGRTSTIFKNIRVGTAVDIDAWVNEMKKLGYKVSMLAGEVHGSDSFEVSW
jgi:hypothetical protein